MYINVIGLPSAQQQFQRMITGSRSLAQTTALIGSRLPYAYGIETGFRKKTGKLARRAGGVFYLERARLEVLMDAERDIAEGLTRVTAPGAWVIMRLAKWVRRLGRSYAPTGEESYDTHSGKLRKSIHIERGARV